MNQTERKYRGDGEPHYKSLDNLEDDIKPRKENYKASGPLIEAVNLALYLKRPLLVEGEPGCGKTCLAYAVAWELGLPRLPCYVRSTSRAQDMLYTYDHLMRLYDIQSEAAKGERAVMPDKQKHLTLQGLGRAIEMAGKGLQSVVLIDEIDKADFDFPNDLLAVLEEWKFTINETGDAYNALDADGEAIDERRRNLPLVIITSNREKELPGPFLRRCLYYFITFPDKEALDEIVDAHFPNERTTLFDIAVQKFIRLREHQDIQWRKPPGTSELLDWIRALKRDPKNGGKSDGELKSAPLKRLPYVEALVKNRDDRNDVLKLEGT